MTLATDDAFAAALRVAYAQLAPGTGERFPVAGSQLGTVKPLERLSNSEKFPVSDFQLGTSIPLERQENSAKFPEFPQNLSYRETTANEGGLETAWAAWQERAAIREFDRGMPREVAELLTAIELGPCPAAPDEFRLS